ncbi:MULTISPECIES: LLM class flavin-dependent oxidoreductase [Gordonia]|uniref:LLM class flavin-dependent oxidoreductase n=1 Tax=Gordonia TaxID=2053 RepID=UPI001331BB06|nr:MULTISPECIES: LLM class flavin-dependent oxidoreductase [Gordonia]KAF0969845.1 F420-dependent glucose-6-phosphate dehydrogenase [Gordonia sp. YY1]MCZ0913047.1 LLM class flavin-dependent oxidoreductase [Gordonia amicalis]UPW14525.1 LLM class flavin-dependent oxidoreductase [Gordonia amicalis]
MQWGLPWPGAEQARSAEDAGAVAFCSGEFADIDAYVTSTEMALGTSTASVGPGIAYAFARSPFVHASALRHLHRLAPGRVFLGLGAGSFRMNRDWFGIDSSHAAPRMSELIRAIRAFLLAQNGERVRMDGRFYSIDADVRAPVLGPIDVPILIGAFNKYMVRTVGRDADGILGHGIFTDRWWSEAVLPELSVGAADAGREIGEIRRWGWVITAVDDDDPESAIAAARRQIAFYLTVKTYDPLVELHGWQDEVEAIRRTFRQDPSAIGHHVTDDMLWSIAVCGDSAQAVEMLAKRTNLPDVGFLSCPGFLINRRARARYAGAAIALAAQEFSSVR